MDSCIGKCKACLLHAALQVRQGLFQDLSDMCIGASEYCLGLP